MSEDARFEYENPTGAMGWLSAFLLILFLFLAASLAALVLQYQLLEAMEAHRFGSKDEMMAAASANDLHVRLAVSGAGIFGIITSIMFLVWLYRASANVHAMGASGLSAGPGFAVGKFFIPIVNLIMPFFVMGEIWKASSDAPSWKAQEGTLLIPLWWFLQVGTSIAAIVIYVRGAPQRDIPSLMEYTTIMLVLYGFDVAFRLSLFVLAKRVSALQVAQYARIRSAAPALGIGSALGR